MLAHCVYFTLKDNSAEAIQKFVSACKKYLDGHPGVTFFAAGPRNLDLDRPVNDLDFDVALHVVFENKAAHDEYQTSERHLAFLKENKGSWKKVRVFDADVDG
jgi:hypothetical protein